MNFNLTEDHLAIQEAVREYSDEKIRPIAAELDEEERYPEEIIKELGELGYMGIPVPEEYGGAGLDYLAYALAVEEISRACASTGVTVSAHTSLGIGPVMLAGTEEQKKKYVTPMAEGKWLGAFGLTEPNAGTDAAGQETVAVLKGDKYILNGSKIFITNGYYGHVYIMFAMTDRAAGTKGISAFIVEKDYPGFSFGKKEHKMGIRGSATYELVMQDCEVPKENLLGAEGKGFALAMNTLDGGRVGIAAQALGIAQASIDETVKYVKERKQFGKRISQFQNTQFELADMQTKVDAARLLTYRAAAAKSEGQKFSHFAAMAKLYAADVSSDVSRRGLQLFGGYGYTREYPIERLMRDAKITELYEGTSEVQKMVISAWMGVL